MLSRAESVLRRRPSLRAARLAARSPSPPHDGIVAYPTKKAVQVMLRHLGAGRVVEIPVRSRDVPRAYLEAGRASWLVEAARAR